MERGDGTKSEAVRADHVAWRHVKRWRLVADDGWSDWVGGTCPVAPTAVVTVRLRDGSTGQHTACNLRWNHDTPFRSADIVAYRVVEADGWYGWGGASESPVPGHVDVYVAGRDEVEAGPFRANTVAWSHVVRYKRATATVDTATTATSASESEDARFERVAARAEVTRLTEQLNVTEAARDAAVKAMADARGELNDVKDLADSERASLRASRDACAKLEAENAALRDYAEDLMRDVCKFAELRTGLNIAALRGHLPLDYDTQLATWSAPRP